MGRYLIILAFLLCQFTVKGQWDLISTPDDKLSYWSVDFTDVQTGFVVGSYIDTAQAVFRAVILRTQDGGTNWDTTFIDTIAQFRSVQFPTVDTGYVTGQGALVYKTVDAGTNWVMQTTPADTYTTSLKSIFFTTGDTGYACSSDGEVVMVKTYDGGQNWTVDTPAIGGRQVFFSSSSVGYTVWGAAGSQTMNGGGGWNTYSMGVADKTFLDLYFINDSVGYVGGIDQGGNTNYGAFGKTNDGAGNWTTQTCLLVTQINSIHFVNENVGFGVGGANATYLKSIVKTIDGGNSWGTQGMNSGLEYQYLLDIDCISDTVCFAVGWDGNIFKTTNGGGPLIDLGIGDQAMQGSVKVYPNPATSQFTISGIAEYPAQLTLFDLTGRVVYQQPVTNNHQSINISHLPNGLYVWHLPAGQAGLGAARGKLVKE